MAQSFKLFFITFAARVFMTCCEQGATINNFFPSLISEKKFIDTVDKLTIYIEKKVESETLSKSLRNGANPAKSWFLNAYV